jgi:hypothetical protein
MGLETAALIGIGGLIVSGVTTGASFANAAKQRKQAEKTQKEAEAAAAEAMAAARKKLEINFYDKLAVQKEPYELAREAALAAGAQAIQAGQESERGSAATAGRVQMAQNEQQRQIATAMGKEMGELEKLSVTEDARLRDIGVQLDMGELEGAQQALLQAQSMRDAATASTQQGIQGLGNLAQQAIQLAPLYSGNRGAQRDAMGKMTFTPEEQQKFGSPIDFNAIGAMSNSEYSNFMNSLKPEQQKMLLTNPQFLSNYNNINPFKF